MFSSWTRRREQVRRHQVLLTINGELSEHRRELEAAQTRLVQNERLAVIGQLASSIAHEINNPLTWLMADALELERLLQSGPQQDPSSQEDARAIAAGLGEGLARIADIVKQMRPLY